VVRLSALCTGRLFPQEIFLVLICGTLCTCLILCDCCAVNSFNYHENKILPFCLIGILRWWVICDVLPMMSLEKAWVWRWYSLVSLTVKVWCIMSLLLEIQQWFRNSTRTFYGICKKNCKRNNQNLSGTGLFSSPWQCIHAHSTLLAVASHTLFSISSSDILQPWSLSSRLFPF
jgi:hypothetical protein